MPNALRVHLALITVSLVFGGNYVFTKFILTAVPPVPAGAWVLFRITTATAVLVPLAMFLRRAKGLPRPRVLGWLLVASFFGVALNQVLFTEGMARTTPEHSAVVNACIPTWTLLVAVLAGQEQLGLRRVLAIGISLCGVLWLLGVDRMLIGEVTLTSTADGQGSTLLGDLLTMANGIAFAIHLVMVRRLSRDVDPWFATAAMFVTGMLMIGAWSGPSVTAADVDAVLTPPTIWFAVYAILLATVLTYLLNTWALRHAQSSQVALYINLQPLVAASLSTAFGAPLPGSRFFVALGLVGFGLWLQSRTRT